MSDFLFSKSSTDKTRLSQAIRNIYQEDAPEIKEFHGSWGSLAVSRNFYGGFGVYEDEQHISVVIGGPLLCFQSNRFLTEKDSSAGTRAIFERWKLGKIQWDEDLSGPFVFLVIDKKDRQVTCVTDLLSFIPVYAYQEGEELLLGTHTDSLARAAGQESVIDTVSEVDFVLFGAVTFPYTRYKSLRQLFPASVYFSSQLEKAGQKEEDSSGNPKKGSGKNILDSEPYWQPVETVTYASRAKAGRELREALQNYVLAVTEGMDHCAQFISGGEDSRVVAALLPRHLKRDAFIFLDHRNREGRIARKAAEIYGLEFNLMARSRTMYLEILPVAAPLVGSGSSYTNVHTYGFHKSAGLQEYPAVFGGLMSDAFLKGSHMVKKPRHPHSLLPEQKDVHHTKRTPVQSGLFTKEVLQELNRRRREHLELVKQFRSESAEEWFELWPISMNSNISNLHGNRRLFRTYEPFTAKEVVKISAAVPQAWKLNRRLFHSMAQPLLRDSKWLLHGDGRFPYFPHYINRPALLGVRLFRKIRKKVNPGPAHQSSWADYKTLHQSEEWLTAIRKREEGFNTLEQVNPEKGILEVYEGLLELQKMRLLQVCFEREQALFDADS